MSSSGGESSRRSPPPGECLTPIARLSIARHSIAPHPTTSHPTTGEREEEQAPPVLDPFSLVDLQHRVVRYLRLGLTDRCNYRCTYCMPAEGVELLPRAELLSFDEIERLVRIFVSMGIDRLRLTGGEPLLRRGVVTLVERLAAIEGLDDLALTTNGHLLPKLAAPLRRAGLRRLNVSLDTLNPKLFASLTRKGSLETVLAGLKAADQAGFTGTKLNVVVLRGVNDGELPQLLSFAADRGYIIRFIEYMPIGLDDLWGPETFISGAELRDLVAKSWKMEPAERARSGGGPARPWVATRLGGSAKRAEVGFITAVSEHFCTTCNRVRLSPEGRLRECLSRRGRLSLRDMLRQGVEDDQLVRAIRDALSGKVDGHAFSEEHRTRESMSSIGG